MFVKIQFATIINLDLFEQIDIDAHYILAKSEHRRPKTLAEFPLDRSYEAQTAFEDLFQALLKGMRRYFVGMGHAISNL